MGFGNKGANLTLIAGTADDVCPATQSEDATKELRSQGYDAELVEVDGADHMGLISMADKGSEPASPYGTKVVATIADAIEAAQP